MNRSLIISFLLLTGSCSQQQAEKPTIEYHGERFRLTRSFATYDEYKETENNIDPQEYDRIEAKILSLQLPREFDSKRDFVLAALKLKFPGFGFGGLEGQDKLHTAMIEIPHKDADRYITAIEKDGRWHVVDDFKGPVAHARTTVQIENSQLIYKSPEGEEFRRTRID